jgi:Tol biopolymer transport system component
MIDRQSGEATRLTRTGTAANPAWAPDGKRLIYIAGTTPATREVWTLPIDGSAEPRRLVEIEGDVVQAVLTPDGRSLVAVRRGPDTGQGELIRVALNGTAHASPLVAASLPNALRRPLEPRISPDGRFVAFLDVVNQELYVRALDGAGVLQVTDGGGSAMPAWAPDSRHLYYSTGHGWAVAEIQTAPALAVVGRRSVGEFGFLTDDYDLSPDGQTFVVVAAVGDGADVLVAVHWDDEVRRSLRRRE